MGKKKVDTLKYIDDREARDITYSKRKRGILKKCIEFSKMCGQDMSLTIFDKVRQKLVQYSSTYDFSPKVAAKLVEPENIKLISFSAFCNDNIGQIQNIKHKSNKNFD